MAEVVVVTGGGAGVGRATAEEFARRGWDVGLLARAAPAAGLPALGGAGPAAALDRVGRGMGGGADPPGRAPALPH